MSAPRPNDFLPFSVTLLADACEVAGIEPKVINGLGHLWACKDPFAGLASTLAVGPLTKRSERHLGVDAIANLSRGDVLVIGGGIPNVSCFGGILATAGVLRGLTAVVADGWCRDIEDYIALRLPVCARGPAVVTARGRLGQLSYGESVDCAGVIVRPGDIIVSDINGILVIEPRNAARVLTAAKDLEKRERAIIGELEAGRDIRAVDQAFSYERMLSQR